MDKREDVGEFYPGGKVVSTRPIAGGADMKHENFSDVAALPSRFTDDMVHDKINELIGLLKGPSAAVALFLGVAAFGAGVTVQTAPKGEVYNDEPIVTNVVFDATGLATTGEVESVRVELGSVSNEVANLSNSIDFSTSNATLVATIEATAPVPGDYETVSKAAMSAEKAVETGYSEWTLYSGHSAYNGWYQIYFDSHNGYWVVNRGDAEDPIVTELVNATDPYVIELRWATRSDGLILNYSAKRTKLPRMEDLPTKTSELENDGDGESPFVTSNALETATGEISNELEQTRAIVVTWESFLDGSNVVFSITNYISGTYSLDTAKLKILELREGAYREVYNSRDEIMLHIDNFKTNDFAAATNQVIGAVNSAIADKADKAWGKYTSAGGEAPSNTVYMTAPNTVFAGGLEYERVAVGEGTVCVLTTKGAPTYTQGDEGTFKFQDDGGTNYFGFAKTDSYTIGVNTDDISVNSGMVTLTYNITMSGRPCVWYKADLSESTPWEQLNLPDGTAVPGASHGVAWEQDPPANTQICNINCGNQPQGFFKTTVEVAGEAKFMTNMKADLNGGIICTNTSAGVLGVIKPSYNGSAVIWTWSAN